MEIKKFTLGPVFTNTYLIYDKNTRRAVIVDPSFEPKELLSTLKLLNLQVDAILLTHAHFDHIGGLQDVLKVITPKVYVHVQEASWLQDATKNCSELLLGFKVVCKKADVLLSGKEVLKFGNLVFRVLHTPGHSPGSLSYLIGDNIFSGDVLFKDSIGRTDLPFGNFQLLQETLKSYFLKLDDKVNIFPGHGDVTTLGREKKYNPFLKDLLKT